MFIFEQQLGTGCKTCKRLKKYFFTVSLVGFTILALEEQTKSKCINRLQHYHINITVNETDSPITVGTSKKSASNKKNVG